MKVLLGFKNYIRTFQHSTHCPFPDMDDPLIGQFDAVKYPEHFWWRLNHLTKDQKCQLMELGSDTMIITPDCLDQFYPEPDPTGMTYRCNRCLSMDIDWQSEWIICRHCNWSEPLYDFPMARRYG